MEIILHDGIDSDAVAAPAATNVPAHVKSEWAQCERCNKWRRLPRTVAAASLKGTWFCELLPSTDEHNSCDAPEERLKYGAWEQEDLRLLQPEVDGTKLILNDQSATGYKGVALQNNESNDLPYRVEYASDERGNIIAKSQGVRKTMYFATDVEAALWPPQGTASSVRGALARIGLEQYAVALEELGYDDLGYLGMLSEERLRQVAAEASMKPGHVGKFAAWLMTGPPAASQWL